MRLLFLCKRHPQQRDLIERPYGRFHYLPVAMAALGHDVRVQLLSHRRVESMEVKSLGVEWSSHDIRTLGLSRTLGALSAESSTFRPDWVIGCSDAWFGCLAQRIAFVSGAKLAVDAYDNYEAYMPWNLPLHAAWRRAIAAADVVTAAGPQLATRLDGHRRGKSPTAIVPMAADPAFIPRDRLASRAALGLPMDAPLIGYMGGWARNRGTDTLLDVFRRVRSQRSETRLVLTGRPPSHAVYEPGAMSLGYLDDAQLPIALSALDIASVITADSSFGRYSYPAKLCEAVACQVPVVATATEPVRWMLQGDERFLVPIGDANAIAARMSALLDDPQCVPRPIASTWQDSAWHLQAALIAN